MKKHSSFATCALLLGSVLFGATQALAQPAPAPKASVPAAPASVMDSYSRRMDSQICTTAPRSEWLPEEEMKLLAVHRGYRIKIFRIDKNNCYEIYGFNKANQIVEAYFDPVTSRLLHQNIAQ